jgi:hypothetical protein
MVKEILTGVSDWDRCGRQATIALNDTLAVKYTDDVRAGGQPSERCRRSAPLRDD